MGLFVFFAVAFFVFIGVAGAIGQQRTDAQNVKTASTLVRTYKSAVAFERDANKLAGAGWQVQTQSSRTTHWGLERGAITVTYVRVKPPVSVA